MLNGRIRVIRTKSIWVRRAVLMSAFRSNSDGLRRGRLENLEFRRRGVSMLTRILFSCAALFAATELGIAADLNVTAPLYVSSWTGCYIGGCAGPTAAGGGRRTTS